MSKIAINDTSVSIQSTLSVQDITKVRHHFPEATTLFEGSGKEREPIFTVNVGDESGLSTFGVTFSQNSARTGNAVLELPIPAGLTEDDLKDWLVGRIGFAKSYLDEIEAQMATALVNIDNNRAMILASIDGL